MRYKEIYEQSVKEGKVETVRPMFYKFEKEGDCVIGRYIGKAEVISSANEKPYNHYIFDTDIGLIKFALSSTIDGEVGALFKLNEVYYIEFLGEQKTSKGFRVKDFDIKRCAHPSEMVRVPVQMDLSDIEEE